MDHCGPLSSFLAFRAEGAHPHNIYYSNQYAVCPSIKDNRVYQGKLWGVNEGGAAKTTDTLMATIKC